VELRFIRGKPLTSPRPPVKYGAEAAAAEVWVHYLLVAAAAAAVPVRTLALAVPLDRLQQQHPVIPVRQKQAAQAVVMAAFLAAQAVAQVSQAAQAAQTDQ